MPSLTKEELATTFAAILDDAHHLPKRVKELEDQVTAANNQCDYLLQELTDTTRQLNATLEELIATRSELNDIRAALEELCIWLTSASWSSRGMGAAEVA